MQKCRIYSLHELLTSSFWYGCGTVINLQVNFLNTRLMSKQNVLNYLPNFARLFVFWILVNGLTGLFWWSFQPHSTSPWKTHTNMGAVKLGQLLTLIGALYPLGFELVYLLWRCPNSVTRPQPNGLLQGFLLIYCFCIKD